MAVRPGTGIVYVAVSEGPGRTQRIVAVTADGAAHVLNLHRLPSASVALGSAPSSAAAFWGKIPARSFTVTDMKWRQGVLYVAGLSNQDFSSALRLIPYPFRGRGAMASVEIYHASHNEIETRAPIRTMTFETLNGVPSLVAAYTCTSLVTIPLADLKDGAQLRGKTIAELGYGNTPRDTVSYDATMGGHAASYMLLLNTQRDADLITVAAVAAADAKPGLSAPVPFGQMAGVAAVPFPLGGALHVANQSPRFLVVLRRDLETGNSQLVSVDKRFNFRLSDFVSEYNFPGYSYARHGAFQVKYIKPVQNTLKREEGYASQAAP